MTRRAGRISPSAQPGRRARWGLCCAAVLLTAGCSTISNAVDALNPFSKSTPKAKPAALETIQPSAALQLLWQTRVGDAAEFAFVPAVAGESVFAAGRDGSLARFDGGRQVWRINAGQPLSGGVGSDGRLVVVGTSKGEVLAFRAEDGRPAWQTHVSSEILAAPAVSGDLVVVRSGDARIFGLAAADGQRRWVYQRSTPALSLRSSVGVTLTDKALYAGFPGGKLVAIALNNGAALWEATVALPRGTTELERIADVASDPVVVGAAVCAAAYQGRVACFDIDNGRQQWARELSSIAGLAVGQNAVFVTDEKSIVQAFQLSSGASLWKQDKLFMRGATRPLALGRHLAIADFEGYIHLLSAEDGSFAARLATDGSAIVAPPRPLGGSRFVVQTKSGNLHAVAAP